MLELQPNKSPATWNHCVRVYEAMLEESEKRIMFDEERVVWEGFFTKLFKQLGLSVPMYSEVRGELVRMGCISQLRRGGGPTPSVWILHGKPQLAKYNEDAPNVIKPEKGTKPRTVAEVLQQQINELRSRIEILEAALTAREEAS